MSVSIRWRGIRERDGNFRVAASLADHPRAQKIIRNVKNMFAKYKELVKIVKIVYDLCEIFVNYKSLRSDRSKLYGSFL
jgi:hypothetical protein